MPDWLVHLIAVPLGLAAVAAMLALLLGAVILVSHLTARRIDHPALGEMTRAFGGDWSGAHDIRSDFALGDGVSLSLTGNAEGPDPRAAALVAGLETRWPRIDRALASHLAAEALELGPDATGQDAFAAARDGSVAAMSQVATLVEIAVVPSEVGGGLVLELHALHDWDEEHVRILQLDADYVPRAFGLEIADLEPIAQPA